MATFRKIAFVDDIFSSFKNADAFHITEGGALMILDSKNNAVKNAWKGLKPSTEKDKDCLFLPLSKRIDSGSITFDEVCSLVVTEVTTETGTFVLACQPGELKGRTIRKAESASERTVEP